jgi:hypothetical protein
MARLDKEALKEMGYNPEDVYLPNRFVTVQLLRKLTGLPKGTIYDWRTKGKLRAVTIDEDSTRIFVDLDHFNAVLDSRLTEEVAYERSLEDE